MKHGAHMTHCFQGEYPHTCKYGDDDCPARVIEKPCSDMKALELADGLEKMTAALYAHDAAAELRRLAEVNAELLEALKVLRNNNDWLVGQNIADRAIEMAEEQQ